MTKFEDWAPHGVIPAVLLPLQADLTIDEKSYRKHLRDVTAVDGISAITVNGHSCEIHACAVDEQRRVLAITRPALAAE
jgi:4-hydroxy-tetrahydrodipicolinate synthase